MFPIPDLQEGRIDTGIIDDLLRQGTDEIIKDPQPVSRNMFDTPSHLRPVEEW